MHIVVKVLSGSDPIANQNDSEVRSLGLEVALSDRVESVKAKIQKLEKSLPSFKQLLLFAGQQLEDGNSLEQYGVEDNSIIFVVFKPTGIVAISKYYNSALREF